METKKKCFGGLAFFMGEFMFFVWFTKLFFKHKKTFCGVASHIVNHVLFDKSSHYDILACTKMSQLDSIIWHLWLENGPSTSWNTVVYFDERNSGS